MPQAASRLFGLTMFAAAFLVVAGAAFADRGTPDTLRTVEREVAGRGDTREAAVLDALIEAVRQVNGVSVSSKRQIDRVVEEKITEFQSAFEQHYNSKSQTQEQIEVVSKGLVKEYAITDEQRADDGWRVRVEAHVFVYTPAEGGRDGKATFAVVPMRASHAAYRVRDAEVPAAEYTRRLAQGVTTHLTQSRRFTVLEREYLDETLGEQKLLELHEAPIQEQAKAGQLLGADYLLVGTLEDLSVSEQTGVVRLTGYRYTEYTGRVDLHFRVIDTATGKVHWADRVRLTLPNAVYQDLIAIDEGLELDEPLIEQAADEVVTRTIDAIHPIKVAKVKDDGSVILNQGGTRVAVGERLSVGTWGELIVDPDTGKYLQPDEEIVAVIEVTRVLPKITYAKVVEGDATQITVRSICRRLP